MAEAEAVVEKVKSLPPPTIHVPSDHPMAGLIDSIPMPPAAGELIEGAIIAIERGRGYVDLPPLGTGIL